MVKNSDHKPIQITALATNRQECQNGQSSKKPKAICKLHGANRLYAKGNYPD